MMNKSTNKIACMILPLLLLPVLFAKTLHAQTASDAYLTRTFTASDTPRAEISTQGGFIEVIGTNNDDIVVEMFVQRGSRYLNAAEEDLDDYTVEIDQRGDYVVIASESNNNFWRRGRSLSVSFRVYVPFRTAVEGRTSGGRISAEYIRNNLSLRTSGGSVRAVDVQGENVTLQTSGGSIEMGRVAGNIEAQTSGGSIRGEVLMGRADLRTSGGSIRLTDVSAELSARTSGGRITADITRFEEDIDLHTSGGSIEVTLASASNFEIDLRATRVNAELKNFSGKAERDHLKGSIGRGGPLLAARTTGGSVTLIY